MNEEYCSRAGIAATEAATNIVAHAGAGELLVCPRVIGEEAVLDLVAIDNGPGIADVPRAMEDGYSTAGTAGQGLGAVQRLANESYIHSSPQKGTVLWARFCERVCVESAHVGVVSVPLRGETACGDGFFVQTGEERSIYMVVDGLGHGLGAQDAAHAAIAAVERNPLESTTELLAWTHGALRATRGAAMSIAEVHHRTGVLKYAGVGNISGVLFSMNESRSMVSMNGTLGAVLPRLQEFTYPYTAGTMLLMYSDGLGSRCSPAGYPPILRRYPQALAGILIRDFSRGRDDATVLVARLEVGKQ